MRKHCLFLVFLTAFPACFFAQERHSSDKSTADSPAKGLPEAGKGVSPVAGTSGATARVAPTTRAVVVGISDYQDEGIPDLQFAHRDAEAFAEWLKSPAGGAITQENLLLLTNKNATNGKISTALYWLLDECREGDAAIFYFSGHGDIEAKIRNQSGFLLTHDSPPNNYIGSALNLRDVQDIVSTLSTDRKVRVLLITDACHAGKLAGSGINGAQATAQSLAQQFANEIKIMSCQPNEFSLEGTQWGDGRGVFSWHLVDGLTGLADQNTDALVTLFEIGRYLEDKVAADAAPHPQMPLTVGNRQATVARVDTASLAARTIQRENQQSAMLATKIKGLSGIGFGPVDSALYARFQAALDSGNLLSPTGLCAFDYFKQLEQKQELKQLHGLMKRNLAAALIDEVQQALNALLADDPYETNSWRYNPGRYATYPEYLQTAIELLGEKHFIRKALLVKKAYFEGYNLLYNTANLNPKAAVRDSVKILAKSKYLEGIALEPTAYLYHAIGSLYFRHNPPQTDSLVAYFEKAVELAPTWLLPKLDAAHEYNLVQNDLEKAEAWFIRALDDAPESYVVLERLAWLYQWQNRTEESLDLCEKMKKAKPDLFNAWATAGMTRLIRKEYAEAAIELEHSQRLNPDTSSWIYLSSIYLLMQTRRQQEAEALSEAIIANPASTAEVKSIALYIRFYLLFGRQAYRQAATCIDRIEQLNAVASHVAAVTTFRGVLALLAGNPEEGRALYRRGYAQDPNYNLHPIVWNMYEGIYAAQNKHYQLADSFFQAALALKIPNALDDRLESITENARFHYGAFLVSRSRLPEARAQFAQLLRDEPKGYTGYYGMALLHAKQGRQPEALDCLEKALDFWYPEAGPILEEPLFKKLRQTKRFKALLAKHFPQHLKN